MTVEGPSAAPGHGPSAKAECMEKTSSMLSHGGKNSALTTAGIIIADVVGGGILGMPSAVAKFGWLGGGIVLTLMLLLNVHLSILMWRVRMSCPEAHTLGELAVAAFAGAPEWQGKLVSRCTNIVQMLCIFSILGLYILTSAKGIGMFFYDIHICLPQWALIVGLLVLPFAGTSREMGSFWWLIYLNVLTLTIAVILPLGYMAAAGPEEMRADDSIVEAWSSGASASSVLSGLSTMTFGFASQIVLIEIIDEMKDPAELPKAYCGMAAPFQWLAFGLAGLGGYYFLGDQAAGMLDQDIPFGVGFRVAAACLATHMLASYFIKGIVFCNAVQARVDPKGAQSRDPRSWLSWNCITVLVLVAAYTIANVVPFFDAAVDLIGALFQPLLCWVLPILLRARLYFDAAEKPKVHWPEWVLMAAELIFALVLLVFGTMAAVENIAAAWESFGSPFACHCEEMWNTCACSPGHLGLPEAESCAAVLAPAVAPSP